MNRKNFLEGLGPNQQPDVKMLMAWDFRGILIWILVKNPDLTKLPESVSRTLEWTNDLYSTIWCWFDGLTTEYSQTFKRLVQRQAKRRLAIPLWISNLPTEIPRKIRIRILFFKNHGSDPSLVWTSRLKIILN